MLPDTALGAALVAGKMRMDFADLAGNAGNYYWWFGFQRFGPDPTVAIDAENAV